MPRNTIPNIVLGKSKDVSTESNDLFSRENDIV